jgi:peptidyl-prolyl cis-trans isomerase C
MRNWNAGGMVAAAVLGAVLAAAVAHGEEGKLVAELNGEAINEADLHLVESELGSELAQVGQAQRRAMLLRYLIDTRLLAKAALDQGLDKSDAFARRLDYLRQEALRDIYVEKHVDESIDEKQLRDIYDREYAGAAPDEEVHARHILLKSEDEAKAIVKRLEAGEDFVALAAAASIGPSGKSGGDLGWFGRGQMPKSFEDAAFALQPGQVSPPVESPLGWHVFKLEERRQRPAPTFAEVAEQIKAPLLQQKARELIDKLRGQSRIDIPDAELANQLKQME